MAVLIDAPRWPAHGTRFAHLVSDTSLNELHAFAEAAGLPPRAFDHDHYDVPERRYHELVAMGAIAVGEKELLRRLRASGLRVRTAERTPSRAAVLPGLTQAWRSLLPDQPALGAELLERWQEQHRGYHDVRHLAHTLLAAEVVADGEAPRAVRLALWFHDAVYQFQPGDDEAASADLAAVRLTGVLPAWEVVEVVRLVRLTASHHPDPDDATGAIVVDADLSILGQPPGRYHVYVRDVRSEYRHLDDATFRAGRLEVISRLAARDPLFATPAGRAAWESAARANLTAEFERWGGGIHYPMASA